MTYRPLEDGEIIKATDEYCKWPGIWVCPDPANIGMRLINHDGKTWRRPVHDRVCSNKNDDVQMELFA